MFFLFERQDIKTELRKLMKNSFFSHSSVKVLIDFWPDKLFGSSTLFEYSNILSYATFYASFHRYAPYEL